MDLVVMLAMYVGVTVDWHVMDSIACCGEHSVGVVV